VFFKQIKIGLGIEWGEFGVNVTYFEVKDGMSLGFDGNRKVGVYFVRLIPFNYTCLITA
jgi:hypothetical protein